MITKGEGPNLSSTVIRTILLTIMTTLLGILNAYMMRKHDDVWDFYAGLEKSWILEKQKNTEKYMAHLK